MHWAVGQSDSETLCHRPRRLAWWWDDALPGQVALADGLEEEGGSLIERLEANLQPAIPPLRTVVCVTQILILSRACPCSGQEGAKGEEADAVPTPGPLLCKIPSANGSSALRVTTLESACTRTLEGLPVGYSRRPEGVSDAQFGEGASWLTSGRSRTSAGKNASRPTAPRSESSSLSAA